MAAIAPAAAGRARALLDGGADPDRPIPGGWMPTTRRPLLLRELPEELDPEIRNDIDRLIRYLDALANRHARPRRFIGGAHESSEKHSGKYT